MSNPTKLTVITTALQKRAYGDFDQWVEITTKLTKWQKDMWEAGDQLEQQEPPSNRHWRPRSQQVLNAPSRVEVIRGAETIAKRYSDHELETMLLRWKQGDDWYNRPELYDDQGKVEHQIVSEQVALLVGSFPNARPHNPEVYTRMLIEEIRAVEVRNVCIIESAFRRIRRSMKFLPTIVEVLKMIQEEGERDWDVDMGYDGLVEIIKHFRGLRDELLATIAEAKASERL